MRYYKLTTQIAKFMGPTWGPPGSCRPQMGPMLAPWTLLSGYTPPGISAELYIFLFSLKKSHDFMDWMLQNCYRPGPLGIINTTLAACLLRKEQKGWDLRYNGCYSSTGEINLYTRARFKLKFCKISLTLNYFLSQWILNKISEYERHAVVLGKILKTMGRLR